jgi:hypothetical protein
MLIYMLDLSTSGEFVFTNVNNSKLEYLSLIKGDARFIYAYLQVYSTSITVLCLYSAYRKFAIQ